MPASDAYFASLNDVISNNLKGASTLRIGSEYRIKNLSLRAGGISRKVRLKMTRFKAIDLAFR